MRLTLLFFEAQFGVYASQTCPQAIGCTRLSMTPHPDYHSMIMQDKVQATN